MAARLVVYFPLADPDIPVHLLDVYVGAGVDVIECGWPAPDPYLDGPDVRASMARALGRDPAGALRQARAHMARRSAPPTLLVMAYAEAAPTLPAEVDAEMDAILAIGRPSSPGRKALETRARAAGKGVAAFLPLPLAEEDVEAARTADIYAMLQAAPGLTGPRDALDPINAGRIAGLRARGVAALVVLGFGVSNGAQARLAIECGADGVVVGSAALRAALRGEAALARLLADLRSGLDG